MKGDPPGCRLSEVSFYILFHVGWLSKWWKTQGLFAGSLRFLSLPRSLREIYLIFNKKFRSNSLNTYTNIHKQLNIQTALTSCVKSPLSLFFHSCSRPPPLSHLKACFLLNPCPWVFPNVSAHFKHQLTSSEESAQNPYSKQLFHLLHTGRSLPRASRLIKRSLWPINNSVDVLINLPLAGIFKYSNVHICLIYEN